MPLLYEMIWELPIPKSHAPPQNIPAVKKFSPDPWVGYAIAFLFGVFVGMPTGRAMLKGAGEIAAAEARRRMEEAKRRRGL